MPSKLKRTIRAVKDQTSISLAKVSSNTSSNLEVLILKATTHVDVPIDEKYVNDILRLVSSDKAQAATCARTIAKRIGRTRNWIVALKSLMLVLRIFQDGDLYFPREVLHAMKRGAKILNLSSFRDDSNSSPWNFTSFIRTFAIYLDERLECFLTGKLQRRSSVQESGQKAYESSKGPEVGPSNENFRDMKPAMLLDKISYWQRLLDRAIATRPTGVAMTNRLVQISLYAVVQESFELYKYISEGLTHLLDSFFHLQYHNCVAAFQTCVKASKQFEELGAFYNFCKSTGVGRSSEYPSVQPLSEELIDTLKEFLKDQSSFASHVEPPNQRKFILAPPDSIASQSSMRESDCGQSEFSITSDGHSELTSELGSCCTSLEDLISATTTSTSRAISIDLEEYPASEAGRVFRLSHAESSRSLPVTNSMTDFVPLNDSSDDEHDQQQQPPQQEQKPNKLLDSSVSKSWEHMLVETLSSPTNLSYSDPNTYKAFPLPTQPENDNMFKSFPSTSPVDNNTSMFNVFPQTTLSDNNTSTFNAFPQTTLPDNKTTTFNAFPQTTLPDNNTTMFNAFPQTTLPDNNTNTFNAFPPTTLVDSNTNTFNTFHPTTFPDKNTSTFNAFLSTTLPDSNISTFNAFSSPTLPDNNISTQNAFSSSTLLDALSSSTLPDNNISTQNAFSSSTLPDNNINMQNAFPSTTMSDNNTSTFNAFLSTPISDNNTNTFNAFPSTTMPENYKNTFNAFPSTNMQEDNTNTFNAFQSTTLSNNNTSTSNPFPKPTPNLYAIGSELVLYESSPPQQPALSNKKYNPFLQDTEEPSTIQAPTFQSIPTFSANIQSTLLVQNGNDPFVNSFSSDQMLSSSMNQHNVLQEQELWLRNQNKIIAKHML